MDAQDIRLGSIADVANALRMASADDANSLGRAVLFLGAGCSVSAGIPLVPNIAKLLVQRLAEKAKSPAESRKDGEAAYRWLAGKGLIRDCFVGTPVSGETNENRAIDWFRVYDVAFSDHFNTPDDARERFSEIVDAAGDKINWAHLCVGELVRQRFVSTVMTTNFDQLAMAGLVRSGVLPVVCDGVESLTRIRGAPHHPQLIELHGSRHTYQLRNSPSEVAELATNEPTIAAVGSIFQDMRAFIVIGYGGREDGVMNLLIKAAQRFSDKRLIWVSRSKDPASLSEKAKQFLATSRNSQLLVDQDADSFFLRLLQALEIGAPETIRNPLFLARLHATTLVVPNRDDLAEADAIGNQISRHRDELEAMDDALRLHRDNRDNAGKALARARDLRIAGKLAEALTLLLKVPEEMRDDEILTAIGEIGLEHGKMTGDSGSLEAAANAWRQVLGGPKKAA